jgi:hypothetical protein
LNLFLLTLNSSRSFISSEVAEKAKFGDLLGDLKEKMRIPTLLSDIPSSPFPEKFCFSERPLENGQEQKSTSNHPGFRPLNPLWSKL